MESAFLLHEARDKINGHILTEDVPVVDRARSEKLSGCVVGAGSVLFLLHGFFEFGALFGLDVGALLSLLFKLLLCTEQLDEGLSPPSPWRKPPLTMRR